MTIKEVLNIDWTSGCLLAISSRVIVSLKAIVSFESLSIGQTIKIRMNHCIEKPLEGYTIYPLGILCNFMYPLIALMHIPISSDNSHCIRYKYLATILGNSFIMPNVMSLHQIQGEMYLHWWSLLQDQAWCDPWSHCWTFLSSYGDHQKSRYYHNISLKMGSKSKTQHYHTFERLERARFCWCKNMYTCKQTLCVTKIDASKQTVALVWFFYSSSTSLNFNRRIQVCYLSNIVEKISQSFVFKGQ